MTINRKHFVLLLAAFLAANGTAVVVFLQSRPPLGSAGWLFLERQRPRITTTADGSEMNFTLVADGLTFALDRRSILGWESRSFRAFQLANLPAFAAASGTFHAMQEIPGGTSKRNSDIATMIYGIIAIAQCVMLSLLLSIRPSIR